MLLTTFRFGVSGHLAPAQNASQASDIEQVLHCSLLALPCFGLCFFLEIHNVLLCDDVMIFRHRTCDCVLDLLVIE